MDQSLRPAAPARPPVARDDVPVRGPAAPGDPAWGHGRAAGADGGGLHYVARGAGPAVLLLHGWPGFWYDWRCVLPTLADEARVVAPDFRGFGDSDRPDGPPEARYTRAHLAADTLALLDALGIERAVVVGYDIGAGVAQELARTAPGRVRALVLGAPAYPGVGTRFLAPGYQAERWYQFFHTLPWADRLVGHDRATVRLYLEHFYTHWAGRRDALSPEAFEAVVDAYARPGAVGASFGYYRATVAPRMAEALAAQEHAAATPNVAPIAQPTTVLWGDADPIAPVAWADRLGEFFADVTLRVPFARPRRRAVTAAAARPGCSGPRRGRARRDRSPRA